MPNKFHPPSTTTATRTASTPLDGELFYDSDEQQFYQGDGTTVGGIRISREPTTTAVKTTNYTANDGERVPCDTITIGAFAVTTPASGWFKVIDVVGTSPTTGFGANNLTIIPATGTVMGAATLVLDIGAISPEFELIGTDWRIVNRG